MSWAGFHALANAWLFALLGPLVLLYFLKLKRPRLQVPSLVLWRQVLQDHRVNSPFRRFRRNLLLLLQVLLVALLSLGAMQPFLWRGPARARFLPVLVDCSASMAALDKPGGRSRLDEARARVREIADNLMPDQQVCLIAFGRTARRLTDFTNNGRILREALEPLRVEDVPAELDEALRMTAALTLTTPFDEALLLTDGNLPDRSDVELPFRINYQQLPPGGPNMGITSLGARRGAADRWDVFVLVEGSANATGVAAVEVRQDGQLVGTEHITADPEGERLGFGVTGTAASSLEVRLVPDGFDSLAADNAAYLDLPALRPLQAFVPQGLAAYRHALAALPNIVLHDEGEAGASAAAYDLVISDRAEDAAIAAGTVLTIGFVPGDLAGVVAVGEGPAQVVDVRQTAPLMAHVQWGDLTILDQPSWAKGASEADCENLGYEVLVHGGRGPLVLVREEPGRLAYSFLFHTDRSTLPYRVGFPVLVANLVRIASERAGLAEAQPVRTGVIPAMMLEPSAAYEVTGPGGLAERCESDPSGALSGVAAPVVGTYSVVRDGRVVARVGAALLNGRETTLRASERLSFSEEMTVAAAGQRYRTDRPLWRPLALLAFVVLLVEWWLYQRRPGGTAP